MGYDCGGPGACVTYVLWNEHLGYDIVKIGCTRRTVAERAAEVSREYRGDRLPDGRIVDGNFIPYRWYPVNVCGRVEQLMHKYFDPHRIHRELFAMNVNHAANVLKRLASGAFQP